MAVIGDHHDHPQSGLRIVLERPREGGPPWAYEGAVYSPSGHQPLRAMVEADGTISVALLGAAEARPGQEPDPVLAQGPALAEKAKLLLRSALKAAMASADGNEGPADSAAPPRRIVRWRGEK